MFTRKLLVVLLATLGFIANSASGDPVLLETGQTVTGTTRNLTLNAGSISRNPNGNATLSNDGLGNLVVTMSGSPANGDYYFNGTVQPTD